MDDEFGNGPRYASAEEDGQYNSWRKGSGFGWMSRTMGKREGLKYRMIVVSYVRPNMIVSESTASQCHPTSLGPACI